MAIGHFLAINCFRHVLKRNTAATPLTWSLLNENVRRLEVFDHQGLRSIASIKSSDSMIYVKVRNLLLGADS